MGVEGQRGQGERAEAPAVTRGETRMVQGCVGDVGPVFHVLAEQTLTLQTSEKYSV